MANLGTPTASRFRYTAWDPQAKRSVRGQFRGDSPAQVRAELQAKGWEPESITPIPPPAAWLDSIRTAWTSWRRRQRRVIFADLCKSLAALVQVGMPLDRALAQMASSPLRSRIEADLLGELAEALRSGTAFHEACAAQPAWFDAFDVAVLAAGQRAGEVAPVLNAVAEHHQRQGAVAQRLITALAYPIIVAIAGLAVFIFLTQSVLPRIAGILAAARAELPWLTSSVMQAGDLLVWWWPVALALPVALGFGLGRWLRRIPMTSRWGRLAHGNPFARLRARGRVAMTSEALARLLRAGVPLSEALGVVAATVPDRPLRGLLAEAAQAVERGQDLSTVMAASPLVEPEFAHMLQLGEGSGDLPEMLDRIALRYQEASAQAAERVAAVIGPVAILLLAALIGVLVLAVGQALSRVADLV
jgi:type II secretory pathway component PulF